MLGLSVALSEVAVDQGFEHFLAPRTWLRLERFPVDQCGQVLERLLAGKDALAELRVPSVVTLAQLPGERAVVDGVLVRLLGLALTAEQEKEVLRRNAALGVRRDGMVEITEGLAPVIVKKLGEVIVELKKRGFTIVLVEQNFRFAAPLADRHYVLEHGEIIATITKEELPGKMDWLHQTLGV